ncbi:MAG TPA: response regulator [Geobacteraceae bacterium]|jgi:DNA-binding NtrC family response regulator|nr:response regulator [Geobacteraceae bacterium]
MDDKAMKKILVVDDEQSILLSMFHALKTDGVEVITSNEIEQAEEALETTHFDLVIADIRMSGVSGIEGLELLTYIKQRFDTEVIIMTGYGTEEIEAEAYRRGALRYFSKPVDFVELLRLVESRGIPTKDYRSMQKI